MPWEKFKPKDERLKFIGHLLEGAKMAPLCREFGICRVTGYKIDKRYKECGLEGFQDRSRAPYRQADKLPCQLERIVLDNVPLSEVAAHLRNEPAPAMQ